MKNMFFVAFAIVLLAVAGCTQNNQVKTDNSMVEQEPATEIGDSMMEKEPTVEKEESTDGAQTEEPDAMVKTSVEYLPFTKAAYDHALSEGNVIFLEFYANWCPSCAAQAPVLEEAFATLKTENVAAFRVNYNDDQTDEDERLLARQFGITYQHTHLIIDAEGTVATRAQGHWSVEKVHSEIARVTG